MCEQLSLLLPLLTAFGLTLCCVPIARRLAVRWGYVSVPTPERWNPQPTPSLGGVAFFLGVVLPALFFSAGWSTSLPLFLIPALMFVLGLYDDVSGLTPATKLVGQISVAAMAIFFGYSLDFFTWPPLDVLSTMVWIVGLTNALNLLDNMDGLASGIGLIAALFLGFLFYYHDDFHHALLAVTLAGALAAFLIYNFPPASLFMGDAGSLFVGSSLSLLTLHTQGQASNMLSLVAVPTLILLVPILDTSLVSLTRLLRGQPIAQGGTDHASHRLVVLGLTGPKAVLLLYCIAAVSGATALLIEQLSYTLSLVLVPLVFLSFTLFTAYLAQVEGVPYTHEQQKAFEKKLSAVLRSLTYQRHLLEIVFDFFLISFAYYLAFVLRFDFHVDGLNLSLYLASLPLVLMATYIAFFWCGIYREVWHHLSLEDLLGLAKGVTGGALLSAMALLFFYRFAGYSRVVFILYPLLLFLGMAGSRVSFRLFDLLIVQPPPDGVPVLIYGAGESGEIAVRACRNNPAWRYRPVGFLDDDPRKHGRVMWGLPILGGADKVADILAQGQVQGLLISSASILATEKIEHVSSLCRKYGVWIRQLRVEFVEG